MTLNASNTQTFEDDKKETQRMLSTFGERVTTGTTELQSGKGLSATQTPLLQQPIETC